MPSGHRLRRPTPHGISTASTPNLGFGLNRESQYNRVLDNAESTECGNLLFPEKTEEPFEPDNEGIDNSVAIKSSGEVCVAYRDDNLETLKYSCNNSGACGGWPVSTVVDSNDSPAQSVLVFDSNDNPTIAYVRSTTNDLMIAHNDGSRWIIEPIAELGAFGGSIDLSISPTDVLRLAFIDDQGTLKVAQGQY